jgi:hypothetical protein
VEKNGETSVTVAAHTSKAGKVTRYKINKQYNTETKRKQIAVP